jgi:hypothetical protein
MATEPTSLLRRRWTSGLEDGQCDANNAPEILGVTGAFMAAAIICVILKIYVRTRLLKYMGADDFVLIAAAILAITTFACFVRETKHGMGLHVACIPPEDYTPLFKWLFFHSLSVVLGVVLVKISIAFFLMRIVPKGWWQRTLWASIGMLLLPYLAS